MTREGNTLSSLIRDAWDKGDLRTLTRNCPLKATAAHISIVGHITQAELSRYLTATDAVNGFANRFLWIAVRRSKLLPLGGRIHQTEVEPLTTRLEAAVRTCAQARRSSTDTGVSRTMGRRVPQADSFAARTPGISHKPSGGARTTAGFDLRNARQKPCDQVMPPQGSARCLGLCHEVRHIHLRRARRRQRRRCHSGGARSAKDGLTRDEIRNQVFNRNTPSHRISQKLKFLTAQGLAKSSRVSSGKAGRPSEHGSPAIPTRKTL